MLDEATVRGYSFDSSKISGALGNEGVAVTSGQLMYEFEHLMRKLKYRDFKRYMALSRVKSPEPNPFFSVVHGGIEPWERPHIESI